ncbi:MAG: 1-acyl-sn-glycerol-3-phosphate acyltransferase, partial [Bacteroidia bacterium]|nr:1-acyl-sn-glycerol-3-phosphate acyltransferase [Bacteroidia bacterium]
MKYLAIVPRTLWKTLFLLNFLLGLIILYPAFKLFLSKEKWFKICFKLMRFWAKWILFIPMIRIKHIEGSYRKKIKGPVIFVANHQSYLDIIMLYCLFDTYFVSVGKVELRKIPLFR